LLLIAAQHRVEEITPVNELPGQRISGTAALQHDSYSYKPQHDSCSYKLNPPQTARFFFACVTRRFSILKLLRDRSGLRNCFQAAAFLCSTIRQFEKERPMLSTILLVVLILILIGALPTWGYSSGWGYGPGGIVGLLLIVVIVLALTGRI
jgi:Protein of unknown function (DUF3309)